MENHNQEPKQPSFMEKLQMAPTQLWANHKLFLIGAGVLILAYKFQDVIFDWLVKSSKRTIADAERKDAVLQHQQNEANNKAEELIQQAEDLGKNRPEVKEDWYKGK